MVDGGSIPRPTGPQNQGPMERGNQAEQAKQTAQMARDQASQAAKEGGKKGAEQAEQPQTTQQAAQANLPQNLPKAMQRAEAMAQEFFMVFENILSEGYESYKTPNINASAGAFTEDHGKSLSGKETQVVREFMRELENLVKNQGMEMSNALRMIKTQQGGNLWQKLQQVFQKGPLSQRALLTLKSGEQAGQKASALGAGLGLEGEGALAEAATRNPGQAMLELIRAEANPRAQVESMILALQLLKAEGLDKSSEKLISHLRNRWGMSDDEMRKFLGTHHIAWFQGPLPKMELKKAGGLWYILLALGTIPLSMVLGLDFISATIAGVIVFVLLLIISMATKK